MTHLFSGIFFFKRMIHKNVWLRNLQTGILQLIYFLTHGKLRLLYFYLKYITYLQIFVLEQIFALSTDNPLEKKWVME